MNKRILVGIFLLFYNPLFAQQTNIGVSLNYMDDYNWNKPLQNLLFNPFALRIQSQAPTNVGVVVEKKYAKLSPSIGVNFIKRNLVYSENGVQRAKFSHHTLEVPANLTKRTNIGNESWIIMNIGGGASYVLTDINKTTREIRSNDSLVYRFSIINPKKVTSFVTIGMGIENKLGSSGRLQVKLQYTYHFVALTQYATLERLSYNYLFPSVTKEFKNNYFMIGATYFPSFFERKNKTIHIRQ